MFEKTLLPTEWFLSSWVSVFLLLIVSINVSDLFVTSDLFHIPGLWTQISLGCCDPKLLRGHVRVKSQHKKIYIASLFNESYFPENVDSESWVNIRISSGIIKNSNLYTSITEPITYIWRGTYFLTRIPKILMQVVHGPHSEKFLKVSVNAWLALQQSPGF